MTSQTELSDDVIASIRSGKKIEAIKRLREEQGLGLKEAKQLVDAYVREHPDEIISRDKSGSGVVFIVLFICIALVYFLMND